jgi:uncharacterized protein (TIGR01777 family)
MNVVVAGSTGLIGTALVRALRERGDQVVRLDRGGEGHHWDGKSVPGGALDGATAVVNLAGASVAGRRWSEAYKREIEASRVGSTRALVEAMRASKTKPRAFVNASATGYYGGRGDEELTEESTPGSDFLARLCIAWEAEAARAAEQGVRTVYLRTGIVLTPAGGALQKMIPPFKAFVGGPVGSGKQWMPWIHLADEVGLILWALSGSASGPLNATAPEPVQMAEFARALGKALHRPAIFRVPGAALRLLVGEMREVMLDGQRALPRKALQGGYRFRFGALDEALRDLLGAA